MYHIDLLAHWSQYSRTLPKNAVGLGTIVDLANNRTGALVQMRTNREFYLLTPGICHPLNQEQISRQLKELRSGSAGGAGRGQGRKTSDGAHNLQRKQVMLDQTTIDQLKDIGKGNLSLGIRILVQQNSNG